VEQVMTGEFTTRLVQQTLERDSLLGEAALQRPNAQMQFSGEILYPRTLAR